MTTPETYFIPSTGKKRFRVIYDEKCGVEPKFENGRRIIEIPDNGILIIKSKLESGWINHEYYLADKKGNKTKVGSSSFFQGKTSNDPSVSLTGTGVISGTSLDKSYDIHYSDFLVHNKDTITNDFNEFETLDSLTRVLVEKCRTN